MVTYADAETLQNGFFQACCSFSLFKGHPFVRGCFQAQENPFCRGFRWMIFELGSQKHMIYLYLIIWHLSLSLYHLSVCPSVYHLSVNADMLFCFWSNDISFVRGLNADLFSCLRICEYAFHMNYSSRPYRTQARAHCLQCVSPGLVADWLPGQVQLSWPAACSFCHKNRVMIRLGHRYLGCL